MQPFRRARRVAPGVLAALVALAVAGCVAGAPTPAPTPSPVAVGPLLTVQTRGGECPDGPCGTTIVIERDGRVHQAAKPPNELGQVWPETLVSLEAAIDESDSAEIRSHPFSGECPTAYDGQEIVFEFATAAGVERIATCEVAVEFGSPLFAAVAAAVGPYVALPAR
jgi:hypothetical protein